MEMATVSGGDKRRDREMTLAKAMPTKPKTHKGIKSQNNKLSKWVEKEYPNFTSYDIILQE